MADTITIDKATFARAFGSALLPDPDDPCDPWGAYTLVTTRARQSVLDAVARISWAPPWRPPTPDRSRQGPVPNPWRQAQLSGQAARMVIDQVIGLEMANDLSGLANRDVADDDYCGTMINWLEMLIRRLRRNGWPIPPPKGDEGIGPLDYLAAGAQFQIAAEVYADTSMSKAFSMAADQLFETASRLG